MFWSSIETFDKRIRKGTALQELRQTITGGLHLNSKTGPAGHGKLAC